MKQNKFSVDSWQATVIMVVSLMVAQTWSMYNPLPQISVLTLSALYSWFATWVFTMLLTTVVIMRSWLLIKKSKLWILKWRLRRAEKPLKVEG